jgi:hypothetical protein
MKRLILVLTLIVGSPALAEDGPDLSRCVEDGRVNVLIVGFDKHKLNYGCAADAYQDAGMYEMAAKMRCKIDEIRHRFLEIPDCVAANIKIPEPEPDDVIADVITATEAQDERHREDIQLLQQEVNRLERELDEVQTVEPPQAPAPVIVQQEFLSESKKDKLRALKEQK